MSTANTADAEALAPALVEMLRGYLDHLAVERGLADNTLSSYRRDLRRYVDYLAALGRRKMGDVTEADVTSFLAYLRSGDEVHPPLSPTSAARSVIAVRGWHKFAHAQAATATDPAAAVRPPTTDKRLPKAIEVDEVEALLDGARVGQGPRVLRDTALLELLYATGARISEAVGLAVDDITLPDAAEKSLDAGTVATVVLHGKGGKTRLVPMGGYAAEAVESYLVRGRPALVAAGAGSTALFLNARGGRLSRQSAWTVLRLAAERAGLSATITPHTLRHSFATHMLDGGADVRVVQELLGHASVTTTQLYTLITVERLREVYAGSHPRARG